MRHHRTSLASASIVLLLALTGCADAPSSDPYAYSTRDEAAAVAENVYATFLAAADDYLNAGSPDAADLTELASDDVIEPFTQTVAAMAEDNYQFSGDSTFELTVSRFSETKIVVNVCENRKRHRIVDATGASMLDPGVPIWVAVEVTIEFETTPRVVARQPIAREKACDHPLFDSTEAAQEAALHTYRLYTDAMLDVYADGGENPERLSAFVTPAFYERELFRFVGLQAFGTTLTDGSTIDFTLAPEEVLMSNEDVMVMMCVDFTNFLLTGQGSSEWRNESRSQHIAVDLLFVQEAAGLMLEAEVLRPDLSVCGSP